MTGQMGVETGQLVSHHLLQYTLQTYTRTDVAAAAAEATEVVAARRE